MATGVLPWVSGEWCGMSNACKPNCDTLVLLWRKCALKRAPLRHFPLDEMACGRPDEVVL